MEKKTVAAVITTYNESGGIVAALNRIADWSRKPDEIIVVDDGSTDRADIQAANYYQDAAMKYVPGHRVWPTRFVRNAHNEGVAMAMWRGLSHVSADCVWFGSVDDEVEPDFLKRAMELIERDDNRMVCAWGRMGRWPIGRLPKAKLTAEEMKSGGHQILSHVTVARTSDMQRFLDPAMLWHCDFAAHQQIAQKHGVSFLDACMVRIGTRGRSYSEQGQRAAEHEAVIARLAHLFQWSPSCLGHLGWPMVRQVWRDRQLDAFTPRFIRHAAQRIAGRAIRRMCESGRQLNERIARAF